MADSERRGAKTEAIRTVMAEHPDWGAKKICEELNRHGIRVSIQMVYKVMKAVESLRTTDSEPVEIEKLHLLEVIDFKVHVVDQYGGLAKVEALVRALKLLQAFGGGEDQMKIEPGEEETKRRRKYRSIDDLPEETR